MTQQFQKLSVPEQPPMKLKKQQQQNGKLKRGEKGKAAEIKNDLILNSTPENRL